METTDDVGVVVSGGEEQTALAVDACRRQA
jgi:hypothetical protein